MSFKNKWIIKSDNRILGPYSYEQVEDLIIKRQISLIDEIRDMETRWSYIREIKDFKPLIDSVRKDLDQKSEATQTFLTSTQQTSTQQMTNTSYDDSHNASSDQKSSNSGLDLKEKLQNENLLKKSEIKLSYHKKPDTEVKIKKIGIMFFCVFFILALVGYFYNSYNYSNQEKTVFQTIRRLNLYGQDQKAIEIFKNLSVQSQDKIATDIIPLWLKLESSGIVNYNKLLDFSTSGKIIGNEKKSQFHLFKFNKAIQLSDFGNANESLVKAIDLDPSSLEVKENDATFMFFQKKYQESSKLFKTLYDQTGKGRFLYGHLLAQYCANAVNLNEAYKLIESHLSQRIDYTRELLLIQMLVTKKIFPNNQQMFNTYYEKFINYPSRMNDFFKISNLVYSDPYEWQHLRPILDDLFNYLDGSQKKILEIYYLIENQNFEEAEKILASSKILSSDIVSNIKITLAYFNNDISQANKLSMETNYLFLSSHLYLLLMKKKSGFEYSEMMNNVNYLLKEKHLFANWAQLIVINYPSERERMKIIIQNDKVYSNDFQPYLDAKALLSE